MHKPQVKDDIDVLKKMGYERRDVAVSPVVKLALWTFGLTIGSAVVTYLLLLVWTPGGRELTREQTTVLATQRVPGPRLQADPTREMQDFRRDEDASLREDGVVDARTGAVHIPVDRAMDVALQSGALKARAAAPAQPGIR